MKFLILVVLLGAGSGTIAHAACYPMQYQVVSFDDPEGLLTQAEHDGILANLAAAMSQWAEHICGVSQLPVNIAIAVDATTTSGRDGGEPTSWEYRNTTLDGLKVFESCASYKLRLGKQSSFCTQSDISLTIEPTYMRQYNFIDPNPAAQNTPIPRGLVDLVTVLAHEVGHGLGIAGWLDLSTGALPSNGGISVYDSLIINATTPAPAFSGMTTTALYGWEMPIYTFAGQTINAVKIQMDGKPYTILQAPSQNIYHYGRFTSGTSDTDLTFFGLMAGSWAFKSDWRISVGSLDFAIISDLGIPVQ